MNDSRDRAIRVVELIGLPGAGKTTIYGPLIKALKARKVSVFVSRNADLVELWRMKGFSFPIGAKRFVRSHPARKRLFALSQFTIIHPEFFQRYISECARADAVPFWELDFFATRMILDASMEDDGLLVVDEGFLHRISRLASASKLTKTRINALVTATPRIDLVVHLTASPEQVTARRKAQNLDEERDLFRETGVEERVKFQKSIEAVLGCARNNGTRVVEVSPDLALSQSIENLVSLILESNAPVDS